MAYYPTKSNYTREQPTTSSRITSFADFSTPDLFDPAAERLTPEDPPPSHISPYTLPPRGQAPQSRDDVDVSHVRVSPAIVGPFQHNAPFSGTSERPGESTRADSLVSPSAASIRSRYSLTNHDRYESIAPPSTTSRSSTGISGRFRSITGNKGRRLSRRQSSLEQDGMDLRLMDDAGGYGHGGIGFLIDEDANEREEEAGPVGVDLTTFTGPEAPQDQATVLKFRELELNGHLTGGLGSGLEPDLTIRSKDLHSSLSPSSPLDLTRRLSKAGGPGRARTLRDLGQRQANRTGKIIEVVVEEGNEETSAVDLSSFAGDNAPPTDFDPSKNRHATFNTPKAITYYPQPNWKPISMQWPYLTALIVVSIVLGVSQEFLYQRSKNLRNQNPPSGLFEFHNANDLSTWDYFSFKYLPTGIAVIYGILWQITDYEVKRLEPFHRLSREGGALAAESINVDYITIVTFFRPFRALRYKHYAVAVSSVATILAVSIIPTFLSASIVLEPSRDVRILHPHDLKFINLDMIWSRTLSGVLGVISILGFILLCQLQSRRSGLAGDVQGIAGLAAMATKSHVLMDFKDLDTVPPRDIHNKLKNRRYSLQNSSLTSDDAAVSREEQEKYDKYRLSSNPHPLMMRLIAGIPFILAMFSFTVFIPICIFSPANIILDKASWAVTALAVGIKIGFQTLEQDVRLMEPFYRLSCRHAPPKVLTLDYTSMAFGYMPMRAFLNGDYLTAFVGVGSVLADVLTVCVTSFAGVSFGPSDSVDSSTQATSETPTSFWASFALSLFILSYLIITATFVYKLRRHPFLPRQPSTIASVLAFIHQSKMLYDFVAVPGPSSAASRPPLPRSMTSNSSGVDSNPDDPSDPPTRPPLNHAASFHPVASERDQAVLVNRLTAMGKTYGLGWFTGRDGEPHCGVDQEELKGDYKHKSGEDARLASMPWLGNWEYL